MIDCFRYGEEAAIQGLGAAGHAVGSAWVVFKIKEGVKAASLS